MNNRLTDLLGIRYPIVQGGMQWVGYAELAAAVSNAGGLGTLTALTQPSPQALAEEIERCRGLTEQPFAVNLTILPTIEPVPYARFVEAIADCAVPIVETAGRSPKPYLPTLKAAGVKVIHKATSVRHCLKAQELGCDAVSVDGFDCAGHPGEENVPNLILIPAVAAQLDIPLIATGGFATGRQMAAALALGADGIGMGTRFMVTREAPVHKAIKKAMVEADERQTALIFQSLSNTARVFRNAVAEQILAIEREDGPTDFERIKPLALGQRSKKRVFDQGLIDEGLLSAGPVIGLIHDIPRCSELVERIILECRTTLAETAQRV